jgi:hypothetical protein
MNNQNFKAMARNKGIIRLEGKAGRLSFYKRKGVEIVREAGGPSARQMRTRKSMRRQRENINEFYHAASPASKTLRTSLKEMRHLWHCDLSGFMTAFLRKVIQLGTEEPGKRSLNLRTHKELLKDFRFNPDRSFEGVFKSQFDISVNAQRNEAVLHVPAFDPLVCLDAPAGATHYRILFGMAVLSEYVFVQNGARYKANDPADGKSAVMYSAFSDVQIVSPPLTLIASLVSGIVPLFTSAVILATGIEFYQQVGGMMYRLKEGGCMKAVAE